MTKIELVRFLSDSAGDALERAQKVHPDSAKVILDEAEELLALAKSVMNRHAVEVLEPREAA